MAALPGWFVTIFWLQVGQTSAPADPKNIIVL